MRARFDREGVREIEWETGKTDRMRFCGLTCFLIFQRRR
jgi:hypothetical protein